MIIKYDSSLGGKGPKWGIKGELWVSSNFKDGRELDLSCLRSRTYRLREEEKVGIEVNKKYWSFLCDVIRWSLGQWNPKSRDDSGSNWYCKSYLSVSFL